MPSRLARNLLQGWRQDIDGPDWETLGCLLPVDGSPGTPLDQPLIPPSLCMALLTCRTLRYFPGAYNYTNIRSPIFKGDPQARLSCFLFCAFCAFSWAWAHASVRTPTNSPLYVSKSTSWRTCGDSMSIIVGSMGSRPWRRKNGDSWVYPCRLAR